MLIKARSLLAFFFFCPPNDQCTYLQCHSEVRKPIEMCCNRKMAFELIEAKVYMANTSLLDTIPDILDLLFIVLFYI